MNAAEAAEVAMKWAQFQTRIDVIRRLAEDKDLDDSACRHAIRSVAAE